MLIIDKYHYENKIDNLFNNKIQFANVNLKDGTLFNFAINEEKRVNKVLKSGNYLSALSQEKFINC